MERIPRTGDRSVRRQPSAAIDPATFARLAPGHPPDQTTNNCVGRRARGNHGPGGIGTCRSAVPIGGGADIVQADQPPTFAEPSTRWIQRDTKSMHTTVQFPCRDVQLGNNEYYALFVLAKLLGGRMGSRLTKALRKQGMVYSVHGNLHADQYHSVLQITTGFNRTEGMQAMMTSLAQPPTSDEVQETLEWIRTQRSLARSTRPSTVAAEIAEFLRCRKELMPEYDWNNETNKYASVTPQAIVAVWEKFVHNQEPYVTTVGKETLPRV